MRLPVALRLSRISNLPTVWSNVLVGVALAGGAWNDPRLPLALLSLSLFYTGGMLLNDAFDREFDARERPERPIPAGEVSATEVFGFGFGMLGAGLALLLLLGQAGGTASPRGAAGSGLALAATILLYNVHHKGTPLGPLLMGTCRMLVYLATAAALASSALPATLYVSALVLLCYLAGLTYAARQEHLDRLDNAWPLLLLAVPLLYGLGLAWQQPLVLLPLLALMLWVALAVRRLRRRARGDVPAAVAALIAGISLLDAMLLAGLGHVVPMLLALGAFALTLLAQRWVSGT
jgi:4-hydroxybenzoate polyprenyltransferase